MAHYTISTGTNGLTIARSDEPTKVFAYGESVSFKNTTTTTVTVTCYDAGGSGVGRQSSPLPGNPFTIDAGQEVAHTAVGHYGPFRLSVNAATPDAPLPVVSLVVDTEASTPGFRKASTLTAPAKEVDNGGDALVSFYSTMASTTVTIYQGDTTTPPDDVFYDEDGRPVSSFWITGPGNYRRLRVKKDATERVYRFEVDLPGVLDDSGPKGPIKGYIKVVKPPTDGDPSDGARDEALKAL